MRIPFYLPKRFKKFKRISAVILPKDAGAIIAYADINKNKVVVEAGTGTGFMTSYLAGVSKKVISFEKREDFYENAKKNLSNYDNVELINKNILDGIDFEADIAVLDMKDADKAFLKIKNNIKETIVAYVPTIDQVINLASVVDKNEFEIFVLEIFARDYKLERGTRPRNIGLYHTAYLFFARRL